jgi:hypothetical protein
VWGGGRRRPRDGWFVRGRAIADSVLAAPSQAGASCLQHSRAKALLFCSVVMIVKDVPGLQNLIIHVRLLLLLLLLAGQPCYQVQHHSSRCSGRAQAKEWGGQPQVSGSVSDAPTPMHR